MRRYMSVLIHRLSRLGGKMGLGAIPMLPTLNQIILDRSRPTGSRGIEWVPYEGYKLKIDTADHVGAEIYQTGYYEPETAELIHELVDEGDTVVDIGAHIGHHTLSLSNAVGESGAVFAFEPHPKNVGLLKDTIERNAISNVNVLQIALSDTDGNLEFFIDPGNTGASTLRGWQTKSDSTIFVEARNTSEEFERLGLTDVDFAKVDVQGAEYEIFVGDGGLFNNVETILLEAHPSQFLTELEVIELFEKFVENGDVKKPNGDDVELDELLQSRGGVKIIWQKGRG